jgi:hypothetical protein
MILKKYKQGENVMKTKVTGFFFMMLTVLIVSACASPAPARNSRNADVTFTENLSCGERFRADGWAQDYDYAFEIIKKGSGYKVKTLANVDGWMIHLDCARDLPSHESAIGWLKSRGYTFRQDGSEDGGPSGHHLTVNRGPLYSVPANLYK